MRRHALILLNLVCLGCGAPRDDTPAARATKVLEEQLSAARASERAARAELEAARTEIARGQAADKVAAAATVSKDEDEAAAVFERAPQESCFQDYCPCDESGPVDKMLCRNIRGGVEVTPEMMAAGAAQRDTQREFARWNREHPENAIPQ